MRRSRLSRLALGLLALAAATTGLGGTTAPTASAQAAPEDSNAFTRLSSCISDNRRLLVLLLIDESGSLRQTDPGGQRVTAAQVALAGLETVARTSRVAVDVQFAGFSVDYNPVGGWSDLTAGSLPRLQGALDTFRNRNNGVDTDYFVALRGAQRQFAERTAELSQEAGKPPCKALLWFTDGKYDIEDRTGSRRSLPKTKDYAPNIDLGRAGGGAQLVQRGRELLCQGKPLVDDLRQDGVVTLIPALSTAIAPSDRAFLGAIAQGADGGVSCGDTGGAGTGQLLDAADLGELVSAFDKAANEIGRGAPVPGPDAVPVCAGTPCPQGRRTFTLDRSLQRFHLLARTGGEGIQVLLEGPAGGGSLSMRPTDSGDGKIGDVPVRWKWVSGEILTIDADYPASGRGWDGTWTVTFVDPSGRSDRVARSQIYLFSDLIPRLVGPESLEAGAANQIQVEIVSEGDERTPRTVPGAQLELTVGEGDPTKDVRVETGKAGPDGRFTGTYPVPETTDAASLTVTMRLTVPTSSNVRLAPSVRSVALPVRLPGLPDIRLQRDHLPAIKEDGSTTATLIVKADPTSAGCVWLAGSQIGKAPGTAGTVNVSSDARDQGSCLKVAGGETRELTVRIDPEGTANGTLSGVLRVAATSDKHPQAKERTLEYSAPMTRPINVAKQAGLSVLLVLLGVLIPLALAYAANIWAARFQPIGALGSALLKIAVGSGVDRVNEQGSTERLNLRYEDFDTNVTPSQNRQRRLTHRGFEFRGRWGRTPFGGSWGEATRPGWFCAGSATRSTSGRGHAARLGLALPGQWVLCLAEGPGDERWELLVFAERAVGETELARLSGLLHQHIPGVAETLRGHREAALEAKAKKASADGRGPGPGEGSDSPWPDEKIPAEARKDSPGGAEPPPWGDDKPPW